MPGAFSISVITRSDVIIKAPSNDPLTAVAIARTLADVAPNHPITKHLAVGYWKGGDLAVEETLYQPQHIEKIVAWGGLASVKHVTRYIQPGLELIALDPKRSATIIGHEAFDDDDTMREAGLGGNIRIEPGDMSEEGGYRAAVRLLSGPDRPTAIFAANDLTCVGALSAAAALGVTRVPVLHRRVLDLGAFQRDELDHRGMELILVALRRGAALEVAHIGSPVGDNQGALELAGIAFVDAKIG